MKTFRLLFFLLWTFVPVGMWAQSGNWNLVSTKVYGDKNYTEKDGRQQITSTYHNGVFSVSSVLTTGNRTAEFQATGRFSLPKASYAPGETISVKVAMEKTGKETAAPNYVYGRVTQQNNYEKPIPPFGDIPGLFRYDKNKYIVRGNQSVTMEGKAPETGYRFVLVYSFTGKDVVYLYSRGKGSSSQAAYKPQQQASPKTSATDKKPQAQTQAKTQTQPQAQTQAQPQQQAPAQPEATEPAEARPENRPEVLPQAQPEAAQPQERRVEIEDLLPYVAGGGAILLLVLALFLIFKKRK